MDFFPLDFLLLAADMYFDVHSVFSWLTYAIVM
jgi:hypothetical protein